MPLGLAVFLTLSFLERGWRAPLPPEPPDPDTALEAVEDPLPEGGVGVLVEPGDVRAATDDAGARSATDEALAAVRDDSFFREADLDAWLQTWLTLRDSPARPARDSPARPAVAEVSFAELFGQPREFRGRAVRLRGTLHRLEWLAGPATMPELDGYWQGWLEPAGGPASPIVVQFLELPAGMPTGMRIRESVVVTGYFLKRYAYQASDTVRVAPLVMSLRPTWRKIDAARPASGSPLAWVTLTLVAVVGLSTAGWFLSGRPGRPMRSPADLSRSLAGVEPMTPPAEALRRLAIAGLPDASARPDQDAEETAP